MNNRKPGDLIRTMRQRHEDRAALAQPFPVPTAEMLARAADALWGKQLVQELADVIGDNPRTAEVFTQFIASYPVSAVVTFAITYGYQLRRQVELQEAEASPIKLLT